MTPKTIIILSAVAIMTGSILISQLFDFIDWSKKKESRRKRMNRAEEYTNQKIRERLNQIIKDAEEHIQSEKSSNPIFQEFYEMGERHILEIVKLHLKELEEKK